MTNKIYFHEKHRMIRNAVKDFVKKEINPFVDQWENAGSAPLHKLFKKMGSLGFLGLRYNPKWGGEGLDYWYEIIVLEELSRIKCCGVPMAILVQMSMATPVIEEFGSDYLKDTYLRAAIKGEMVSAIAITEPGAGSDVAALSTTAIKDGNSYIINGSKTYITNGTQADFITTLVRTNNSPGHNAFSLFIIPTKLPGFKVGTKLNKIGMKSSDTAEIYFDNIRVPAKNLIGLEGRGFIQQMKQFQHERFAILPMVYIKCRDLIDETVKYLKTRIVFGEPLIKKQVLRHRLVKWLSQVECLKQLAYHITRMKIIGEDPTKEISMGKLIAGDLINKVTSGCLQMYGGSGFMEGTLISRVYRDAKLFSIGAGASEVMSEIIAKKEGY